MAATMSGMQTSAERDAAQRLDTMLTKLRELQTSFGPDVNAFLADPNTSWCVCLCLCVRFLPLAAKWPCSLVGSRLRIQFPPTVVLTLRDAAAQKKFLVKYDVRVAYALCLLVLV